MAEYLTNYGDEPTDPTWSDYGGAFMQAGHGLSADLDAAARYIAGLRGDQLDQERFKAKEDLSRLRQQESLEGMSDVGRERLQAAVTSGEFWSHPFSGLALKSTGMLPSVLVSVLPAAPLRGLVATTSALAATGGVLNTAQMLSEFDEKVDAMSTEDLAKESPVFRGYLDLGMSEAEAREQYRMDMIGAKPALSFLAGAITNAFGPGAQALRAIRGEGASLLGGAERGILGRVGQSVAEGGISEAADEGASGYLAQTALIQGGVQSEIDTDKLTNAVLEGGLLGGVLGGAAGVPGRIRGRKATAEIEETVPATTTPPEETAVRDAGAAPKGISSDNAVPPPTDAPVGAEHPVGHGSERDKYAKGAEAIKVSKRRSKKQATPAVVLPPADASSGELAVALEGETGKPKTDPIAAVSQAMGILQQEQQAAAQVAQPVTPPVTAPVAPVAQAPVAQPVTQPVTPQVVTPGVTEVPAAPVQRTSELPSGLSTPQPATAVTPQPTGRVLASKGTEESAVPIYKDGVRVGEEKYVPKEAEKLLKKKQLADQKAALAVPKEPGKSNDTAAEKAAAEERLAIADEIARKYEAREGETMKEALERAAAIVSEAEPLIAALQEKHKLTGPKAQRLAKIPSALRGKAEEVPPALAVLREAADLVKWLRSKARSPKEIELRVNRFRNTYKMAPEVVQQRREEGDAVKKVVAEPDLERMKAPEGAGDVGADRLGASPEEILEAKQEGEGDAPTEKEVYEQGRERKQVVVKGGGYETPKAPKAPVVEKKGQRQKLVDLAAVRAKREAEKASPNSAKPAENKPAAKPTTKNERAREAIPRLLAELREKGDNADVVKQLREHGAAKNDIDTAIADFYLKDSVAMAEAPEPSAFSQGPDIRAFEGALGPASTAETHLQFRGERFATRSYLPGTRTTTLRRALNSLIGAKVGGPIADAGWMGLVRSRIILGAGDVPVHVVDNAVWDKLVADRFTGVGRPGAFYNSVDDAIYLPQSLLNNPYLTRIMFHEAVHAATSRAIQWDPRVDSGIRAIMRQVAELHPDIVTEYGFTNAEEFLAEALSNAAFQKKLGETPISPALAKALGMSAWKRATMFEAMIEAIRKILKLPKGSTSALEAAIRMTELAAERKATISAEKSVDIELSKAWAGEKPLASTISMMEADMVERGTEAVRAMLARPELQEQLSAPKLLKLRMFNQLAQLGETYFGSNNPIRKIYEYRMRSQTHANRIMDAVMPMVKRSTELERKYHGKVWDDYTDLEQLATNAGVDPNGPPIKGKKLSEVQARAIQDEARRRYNSLPDDLKKLWTDKQKYFAEAQREAALAHINNGVFKALDIRDDALAQRLFDDKLTDADVKQLEDAGGPNFVKHLRRANILMKMKGAYFPQIRDGNYVVYGKVNVPKPDAPAKKLADNEYEFTNQADAEAYAGKLIKAEDRLFADVKKVWVDKTTGQTHVLEDDVEVKVSPKDVDAEARWRVTVQDEYMDLRQTEREALAQAAELEKLYGRKFNAEPKRRELGSPVAMTPPQMQALIKSIEQTKGYRARTDADKAAIRKGLIELSVQTMGSTRIQTHRLPRRRVKGASKDSSKALYTYGFSMSQHLGRMKYAPEIEQARAEMRKAADGEYAKETGMGRGALANEVDRRLDMPLFEENDKYHPWIKRALTLSFLDKLAGPSHSIINALQTAMTAAPVLAGRHGAGSTFEALRKAYNDIGGLGVVKAGLKGTVTTIKGGEPVKLMDDIIAKLKDPDEIAAFKKAMDVRAIDPEAGLEVSPTVLNSEGIGAKLDKGLHWASTWARQMPSAIEAINRGATLIAAYRLEKRRTGNHEAAMKYAIEMVEATQFVYDYANLPPVFKHPVFKLALQFKSYAQGMYHLLGTNVGKAIYNLEPGDRAEALKSLGYLAATHMAFAGVLGLPTEPTKMLLLGLQAVGLTTIGMDDLEDEARRIAASLFGKTAGELVTKGLPRGLGFDLSGRVGLDSLLLHGEPRKRTEESAMAWAAKSLSGPVVSLGVDMGKGSQALMNADWLKAAELMIPLKTFADTIKAFRQSTEGKKSAAGKQTMTPYSIPEAVTRTLGFTPAREAESSAQANAYYSKSAKLKESRASLTAAWVNAKPEDKREAFAEIQKWNRGRPDAEQLKMRDLTTAAKRATTVKRGEVATGITPSKREQHLMKDSPYNADVAQRAGTFETEGRATNAGFTFKDKPASPDPYSGSLRGVLSVTNRVKVNQEAVASWPESKNIEDRTGPQSLRDYKTFVTEVSKPGVDSPGYIQAREHKAFLRRRLENPKVPYDQIYKYPPVTEGELGALYNSMPDWDVGEGVLPRPRPKRK